MTVETLNYIAALGTVGLQIITIIFLAAFVLRRKIPAMNDIVHQVGSYGLLIGFLLSLGASVVTLYYSDVLGMEPCWLCWFQRIFLYPQVILFAIAAWKRDYMIAVYSIALSVIGLLIALYHHVLQMAPAGSLPCPAVGVSCAQRTLFEFGYVTFPLMAVTVFASLIIVMLIVRKRA